MMTQTEQKAEASAKGSSLPVGVSTYGYLHREPLDGALSSIARAGYALAEIALAPPHFYTAAAGPLEVSALNRLFNQLGLTCVAVTPVELNPISPNAALRELALEQSLQAIRLAHDLAVPFVVLTPGRLNPFVPMAREDALASVASALERLLPDADQLGVRLALETSPYGAFKSALELATFVAEFGHDSLGITFDCANVFANEDVSAGVASVRDHLLVAHLSDTWHDRFTHTSIGRGQIDFGAYAAALKAIGFRGPTIYELMDGEDPEPRIVLDRARLCSWGWTSGMDRLDDGGGDGEGQ
jgi:L-ribulose-5-phosphate 3-epimerase